MKHGSCYGAATDVMTVQLPRDFEDAFDTAVEDYQRDRRGVFRPERLSSSREREIGRMSVRLFRAADAIVLIAYASLFANSLVPAGLLAVPAGDVLPFAAGGIVAYAFLKILGLYRFARSESFLLHIAGVFAAIALATVVAYSVAGFSATNSRIVSHIFLWSLSVFTFFFCLHSLWLCLIGRWRREGRLTHNVVVIGATRGAKYLIDGAHKRGDVNVLGIFDDRLSRNPAKISGVPVLGDVKSLLGHRIAPYIDEVVIAIDTSAKARVRSLTEQLRVLPNNVHLLVDLDDEIDREAAMSRLAGRPIARVSGAAENELKALVKRLQDIVLGTSLLLAFAPVMMLTALAVKLDSSGPIFFRQRRYGFNNEVICVWKFRSMYTHMTDHTASQQVQKFDPRVTRIGRIIRQTSLDELPQLFNVISGEMSLVGPRPHAIGMKTGTVESERLVAEYAWRHRMKPGVTGWAAIKGSRGPLDTVSDVRRRVALDIEYIERQSFWFDLYIMAMTGPCLLGDLTATR